MMTQKQRQLLEILKRQQGMMTVAEYAEKVGVSERTIHNYLHDMQSVFEENGLVLNRIPSRGIEVIKMQADTVREEMENDDFSMENRRHELIHRVLLKGERVNLPEFSDEYYVEEGTIRKDVSYLNSLLNNGITVTIENECIFVKTFKEADLVNALTYLCGMENQNDNFRRNVFADTVLDAVKEVLDEVGTFLQLNIADQYMQNISSALAVLCTRVADGNHIPEDESLLQFDKMKQMADILLSPADIGLA